MIFVRTEFSGPPARRAGIILLPLWLALAGCAKQAPATPGLPEPKVNGDQVQFAPSSPQLESIHTEEARPRTVAVHHLTGRLYLDDDVTVHVFSPVAGRVTRVLADLGQAVTNGSALVEVDSPDFGQALSAARTAVANLAAADKSNVRTKELLAHGAAAQKDLEASEAAYLAALAERDRAEAVLANFGGSDKSTNELYVLRAPLAGVIVDKSLNPGQELRADMMLGNVPQTFNSLLTISDPTKLWLQLDVPEKELSVLATGEKLIVHSEAFPVKAFEGTVDKIGDSMDPATRTVKVRGRVANPQGLLKAEMYVTVDVVRNIAKLAGAGVEVSSKALFQKGNDNYLFVEEAPRHFVRRQVTVGTEKDNLAPIFAGVKPKEKVVTEGCLLLQALVEPDK